MMTQRKRKQIIAWLTCCLAMVALMVAVGGITRLTESGLSIVEWQPLTGILPPLSNEAWQESFALYQQTPEYKKINTGMSLEDYQGIFWLEFIHRLLGRITGLVFFLPMVIFAIQGALPFPLIRRLAGIFLLGGAQGVVGWYMVQSGLVNDPWVSPLRLALHLGLAFIIFAMILRTIFLVYPPRIPPYPPPSPRLMVLSRIAPWAVFIQAMLGALLAGLDGGLTYNSFPLMDGQWIPDGLMIKDPWHKNFYANITLVQFNHRLMGVITTLIVAGYGFWGLHTSGGRLKAGFALLSTAIFLQFALGVLTLLHHVPIALASLHQIVALAIFGGCIMLRQILSPPFLPPTVASYAKTL